MLYFMLLMQHILYVALCYVGARDLVIVVALTVKVMTVIMKEITYWVSRPQLVQSL